MNRTDFRRLFAYSDNCWRVLGETLTTSPEAWEAPFVTTSQWNTIRLLLAHSIGAEQRLVLGRLQNLPSTGLYEEKAGLDWDNLYTDHRQIRTATYAYLDAASDSDIEGEEEVLPATAERGAMTRSDLLFQVFNHENYHRGQIITILQRLGADPPNFDYLLLKG